MTEGFSHTSSADRGASVAEIKRHPSAALYDVVFATVLPGVVALAEYKNVFLRPDECEPLLRHALEHISRKAMKRLMNGNPEAVLTVQLAISQSLDVFAAAKMIGTLEAIQGISTDPATLVAKAEEAMKPAFANDKAPTIRIWPDLASIAHEYYRRETETPEREFSMVQGAASRVSISKPSKLWNEVIRAATPVRENLVDG